MTMLIPTLALTGWVSGLLTLAFLLVCLMLILIVLIQRPQGGGLSGAFGSGAGSGQTAFGAKTGDALTIGTISIFVIFILAAVGLNFAARPSEASDRPVAVTAPEGAGSEAPADAAAGDADADEADGQPADADDAQAVDSESDETVTEENPPADPAEGE